MRRPADLTGLVLAGGRSRRMGHDKATLVVDGERLVDRAAARLGTVCGEVLVASGDGRRLPGEWRQVADATPDTGPLGGILAGLEASATDLVAVVAVDLPDADPAVLVMLAERWQGEAAVMPEVEGRWQPLHAVWAAAAAPRLRALLDAGERSVVHVATLLGAVAVPAGELGSDPRFAANLNRPDDLTARARLGPPKRLNG